MVQVLLATMYCGAVVLIHKSADIAINARLCIANAYRRIHYTPHPEIPRLRQHKLLRLLTL